jgi:16S rRNA (cytidine1402-2'-O)-methyltransferase
MPVKVDGELPLGYNSGTGGKQTMPLYIVATPIGNLEDISLRALQTLREVKLIAAEDTRRTRKLLNAYDIKTPMTSYHQHNKLAKLDYILDFLKEGDVALVSDAGMPGISDPGYELIVAVNERGIPLVPIPGPSVVITALAVSGLDTGQFRYIGYLPARASARRRQMEEIAGEKATIVVFEAPHRLTAALRDILEVLGDRKIAVCRELTKLHEEVFRGTVSGAIEHFAAPRGEFTLVIEGSRGKEKPELTDELKRQLGEMKRGGAGAKEAAGKMAKESGLSRKELYQAWLELE